VIFATIRKEKKVLKDSRPYSLEERTFLFAKEVRIFIKTLNPTVGNTEDSKQVVRSSGSVGANYIEANESLSDKDFVYRIKITRKEAKETVYWLKLINETNELKNKNEIENLIKEGEELKKFYQPLSKNVHNFQP